MRIEKDHRVVTKIGRLILREEKVFRIHLAFPSELFCAHSLRERVVKVGRKKRVNKNLLQL